MTATLWIPIISAAVSGAAGITGALLGTRVTQRATEDREERQYRRQRNDKQAELLRQLYIDMARHAQATGSWLYQVTDHAHVKSYAELKHPIDTDELSARVELFCGSDMFVAWSEYMWQLGILEEEMKDIHPQTRLEEADTTVQTMREKIRNVKNHLRNAVDEHNTIGQ